MSDYLLVQAAQELSKKLHRRQNKRKIPKRQLPVFFDFSECVEA